MTHTILVVDDQPDERDAMADLLRRHHYLVDVAGNGKEAIDRLRDGALLPSAVLLDLNMPVMDGWEFLFHIAQDDVLRHMPVIVISGSPFVMGPPVAPSNVAFMAKPVRPKVILGVIADMLLHTALARAPVARVYTVVSIDDVDTERYVAASREPVPLAPG
jgi:CheY-like chemotaxis protein